MYARRLLIALTLCLALAAPAAAAVPRGWAPTGSMSVPRGFAGGALLDDGRFLIAGGDDGTTTFASAEIYDPATGTWAFTDPMTGPRAGHAMLKLDDGRVLAAGGYERGHALATAEVYDPAKGTWSGVGSMTTSHARGMSARLGDGRVVVAGGLTGDLTGLTSVADVFDPRRNTWATQPAAMPGSARTDGAATTLGDGRVLVAGGFSGGQFSDEVATFNGAWTPANPVLTARHYPALAPLPGGRALLVGGSNGSDDGLKLAATFEPSSNSWSAAPAMASARLAPTATALANGRILVAGGWQSTTLGTANTAELYDPVTNAWSPAGSMSAARFVHSAALLRDGRVLVAGGVDGLACCGPRTTSADVWTPTTALVADPALGFGEQAVGTRATGGVQITNTGDSPLLTADFAIAGINPGDYSVNGDRCRVIAVGATCALDVRFAPTAAGNRSATLTFSANTAAGTHAIPLSGRGVSTADADGDGVIDANDRCRTLKGTAARQGCPAGLLADPSIRYRPSGKGIRVLAYYVKATSGARVKVKCSKGCRQTVTKGKGAKRVRITRLNNRRLGHGTKITITVSKAGRLTTTVIDRVSKGRRIEGRPRCTPVGC